MFSYYILNRKKNQNKFNFKNDNNIFKISEFKLDSVRNIIKLNYSDLFAFIVDVTNMEVFHNTLCGIFLKK